MDPIHNGAWRWAKQEISSFFRHPKQHIRRWIRRRRESETERHALMMVLEQRCSPLAEVLKWLHYKDYSADHSQLVVEIPFEAAERCAAFEAVLPVYNVMDPRSRHSGRARYVYAATRAWSFPLVRYGPVFAQTQDVDVMLHHLPSARVLPEKFKKDFRDSFNVEIAPLFDEINRLLPERHPTVLYPYFVALAALLALVYLINTLAEYDVHLSLVAFICLWGGCFAIVSAYLGKHNNRRDLRAMFVMQRLIRDVLIPRLNAEATHEGTNCFYAHFDYCGYNYQMRMPIQRLEDHMESICFFLLCYGPKQREVKCLRTLCGETRFMFN
ncbi:MAG: hypothetical protein MHM6MM_003044 [Cercozoa sp. M6MM]